MARISKKSAATLAYQSPPPPGAAAAPLPRSCGAFLIVALALMATPIAVYARERWLAVVMLVLTDGLVVAAWVLCAWLLGKAILRTRGGGEAHTALRFATCVGLGLGAISLSALGLGLAGLLNKWTAALLLLAGPLAAIPRFIAWAKTKPSIPIERWLLAPVGGQWLLVLAAPLVGIMMTGASIVPGLLWKPEDPHPYDALEYHLQIPREWYESGRIVQLHHNVFSYFPNGVEVHYLMAMHLRGGPWAAMYQCQFFSLAWVLLGATAVYGAIREMGASAAPAAAGAAAVTATPWMVMLGSVPYTESALALYTALAVAWVLRAVRDDAGRAAAMILAGAMAGFACGVKYTAVPMVVLALGTVIVFFALVIRDIRRWLGPLLAFAVIATAVASPWLIRNVIWTRNPVFPLAMAQLGRAHFDPGQVERFRIAHAPTAAQRPLTARIQRAGSVIFADWQYGYLLWPAVATALVLAWRRRETGLIAGYLLAVLIVWIGFTHLLGRFYVLTIPIAAMALGLVRWKSWSVAVSLIAMLTVSVSLAVIHKPLEHAAALARQGFFGLDDLSYMIPPELDEMTKSNAHVSLVGDAEGFLYPIPSARLHYRTVFDLPGDATDVYQAWLGVPRDQAHGLIVIHPMEVERLSKTYYHVPGLPADFNGPLDRPSIEER